MGNSTSKQSSEDLEAFSKAMTAMGERDFSSAAKLFEQLIADTDGRHLRDRCRQFLAICQQANADDNVGDDPYFAAVFEKNRGNLEAAMEHCGNADEARFVYLRASLKALMEEEEAALAELEKAIELDSKSRVHAFHDPDFQSLRGNEGFVALINPPKAEAS